MTIRYRGLVGLLAILVLGAAGVARADTRDVELYPPHPLAVAIFPLCWGPRVMTGWRAWKENRGILVPLSKMSLTIRRFRWMFRWRGMGSGWECSSVYLTYRCIQLKSRGLRNRGCPRGFFPWMPWDPLGWAPGLWGPPPRGLKFWAGGASTGLTRNSDPVPGHTFVPIGIGWTRWWEDVSPLILTSRFVLKCGGIGGASVWGSATDLTTRFWGAAHYRLDPVIEVFAGYRMTDIKTQNQNGTTGSSLDARVSGPMIGLTFVLGG
jgi:hypothetical protein